MLRLQVNQSMKRFSTSGRGSCVGGRTLSTTSFSGNKFWKYLIWKYGCQLLERDEIPDHLNELERNNDLVTAKHVSKRPFSETTCSNCFKCDGSTKHGHNKNMSICPCYNETAIEGDPKPNKLVKKERLKRKAEDRDKLDILESESILTQEQQD